MNLHRILTPAEEVDFRKWARENYKVGTDINTTWHPVVINEIGIMTLEKYNKPETTYKVFHNVDGEKTTTLNSDAEFIHFMRLIAIENGDEELSITSLGEAKDYLENYCPNLTLL